MKILKVCSLFAGCGGLDWGFEKARHPRFKFKVIWANDFDKSACATYKRNFPNAKIVYGDIWKYDLNKMPKCDVILGGFPCQDFSIMRKRKNLRTKRRLLYLKFVEAVRLKTPLFFVAENVKGLMSVAKGYAIKRIKDDFEKEGYKVKINLVKFAEYGVPQKRERIVIVGIKRDYNGDFELLELMKKKKGKIVKDALKGVEKVRYNNEEQRMSKRTIEMLNAIPPGGNYKDLPKNLKVKGLMSNTYRRLHPAELSPTILACGGGGTWGYHYSEPRSLTNRERARLQTFPDSFIFEGSMAEVRRQVGNAVPPKGAKRIAKAILQHLDKKLF